MLSSKKRSVNAHRHERRRHQKKCRPQTNLLRLQQETFLIKSTTFFFKSLLIISLCVQCFFLLAITDVTYQCIHDPDVDCFKKKDDVKLSDTNVYDESPVNCSLISRDDFVICYRISAFDAERAFIGAAAGYLLFKFLNFSFLVVSYIMIWMAQKFEKFTFRCLSLWFLSSFWLCCLFRSF